MDYLDYLAERMKNPPPEKSWTIPPDAGGADPFDDVVIAFCDVTGTDARWLPEKERKQWARKLRQIADLYGVGPSVLKTAILSKPDSDLHFKAWSNPHQAQGDIKALVLQHLSGSQNGRGRTSALDRLANRMRGPVIEGEVIRGEVL